MQEDTSKILTDPSTTNHQAVDGIHVTTQSTNIGDKKVIALRNLLQADPQAADVKFSLFVAACQSYRYDSCLKPFPPQFIRDGIKDIDALVCETLYLWPLKLLDKGLSMIMIVMA
jgi:poly[ADP-ribose] polymerase 16